MSIENGSDIILYVDSNRVASLKTNAIEPTRAIRDTTTKDSPNWKTLEYGLGEWKMTADGLVLGSSKNLLLYSENLENAAWVKTGCSVESYYAAGVDGKITAGRIYNLSSGDTVTQTLDGDLFNTVAQDIVISFYAKGTGNLNYSLEDGSASDTAVATLAGTYSQYTLTITTSGDSSDIILTFGYNSATTVTIDQIQLEYGSVATAYVPTGAQYTYLINAIKNKTKVSIEQTDRTTGHTILSGTAVIDSCTITAPLEDNVTFTASFTGDGELTHSTI